MPTDLADHFPNSERCSECGRRLAEGHYATCRYHMPREVCPVCDGFGYVEQCDEHGKNCIESPCGVCEGSGYAD